MPPDNALPAPAASSTSAGVATVAHTDPVPSPRRVSGWRLAIAVLCLVLALAYLANATWNIAHLLPNGSIALSDSQTLLVALTLPFFIAGAAVPVWVQALSALGFVLVCGAGVVSWRSARGAHAEAAALPAAAASPAAPPALAAPTPPHTPAEPAVIDGQPAGVNAGIAPAVALSGATLAVATPPPAPTPPQSSETAPIAPAASAPAPRVFISHASGDNDFGYPMVDRLRAELGSVDAVFYDSAGEPDDAIGWAGGIHPAGYWERDIFRQLCARPVFVVLLSEAALASPWVQDEILLAWKQKNERGRTAPKVIVPVIVPAAAGMLPPEPLDLIQTISFPAGQDEAYEDAFQALLAAIRFGRTQLWSGAPEPPFDVTELAVPEHFVGREDELTWVLDRLTPGATAAITALRGLGGIGKTALAAVAVQRCFEEGRFPSGPAASSCRIAATCATRS